MKNAFVSKFLSGLILTNLCIFAGKICEVLVSISIIHSVTKPFTFIKSFRSLKFQKTRYKQPSNKNIDSV